MVVFLVGSLNLPHNYSTNITSKECITSSDPRSLGSGYSHIVHYTIISIHGVVILISLFLNILICHVYREGNVPKVFFNKQLVSLALADILTSLGMIPFIAISPILLRNVQQNVADILCTIVVGQFIFWIGNSASIMTLTCISISRYVVINYNMTSVQMTFSRNNVKAALLVVPWLLALALPFPNLFTRKFDSCSTMCPRVWPKSINGGIYAIATVLIGYLTPIGIMLCSLITSIRTLWFKEAPEGSDVCVVRGRKRVIVLLIVLVVVFLFWWSPFAVYWILSTTTHVFPNGVAGYYERAKIIYIVTLSSLFNALANPIIYGLKSKEFRRAIQEKISLTSRSRASTRSSPLLPVVQED